MEQEGNNMLGTAQAAWTTHLCRLIIGIGIKENSQSMKVVLATKNRTWNRAEQWREGETEGGQNLCSESSELYELFTAKQVAEGTCCPGRTHRTRHPSLVKPDRGSSEALPGQLPSGTGPMCCEPAGPRHSPGVRRSCVYHSASPSPCRFFLPAPWILKWTWSSQSLRKQGCGRNPSGVRAGGGRAVPSPRPSLPGLSPHGSRWSPPDCARRASGARTGW